MAARRSIFTRLTAWSILLAIALVVALWAMADRTVRSVSEERLARAVDVDLAGLADIHASGGLEELVARIDDRLALVPRDGNAAHYLLARGDGTRLAGDLQRWPALDPRVSQAGTIELADGAEALGRATQLGPDLRLLVAREPAGDTALLARLGWVFAIGGALLVLGVGLLGYYASRRLAGRIERVNHAFREPETALPPAPTGGAALDEIGELTRRSRAALARLQRLVLAHRETSDQVAHEVRTPLMHLDHRLVKALEARPDPIVGQHLIDARAEIRHLVAMLEALLDIASSKARQGDRHGMAPFDLSATLERIGSLYASSAEESGHRFDCDIEPGVTMEGEEMQVVRLVTNLLDNAFKYVPSGGRVELSLRHGPIMAVRDDGPGIPPDARAQVFERFNRGPLHGRTAATADEGQTQGSGLGLTLARAIAERHELQLVLEDSQSGAHFVVRPEPAGA